MTTRRLLLCLLLLGCGPPGAADPRAGAASAPPAEPECRDIIGGTGGAHVIRTVCPERDRRLAEMGGEMLRYRQLAGANCASGVAVARSGGRVDRPEDYSCAEPAAPAR